MEEENKKLVSVNFNGNSHRMEIDFQGEVDADSIRAVVDWIEQGLNYYHYDHIVLKINSPGGRADALLRFVSALRNCRRDHPDFKLETVSVTQSCSAAALMLSLGTVGFRSADRDSRLIYHHSRISLQHGVSTADDLGRMSERLFRTDNRMLIELCRHVHQDLNEEVFELLEICCMDLQNYSARRRIGLLKKLRNKKITTLVNRVLENQDSGRQHTELENAITGYLEEQEQNARKMSREDALKQPVSLARQLGYLCKMITCYRALFQEDKPLDPWQAVEYGLIDRVTE